MTMDGGASQYRLRRTKGEGEGSDLGRMPPQGGKAFPKPRIVIAVSSS